MPLSIFEQIKNFRTQLINRVGDLFEPEALAFLEKKESFYLIEEQDIHSIKTLKALLNALTLLENTLRKQSQNSDTFSTTVDENVLLIGPDLYSLGQKAWSWLQQGWQIAEGVRQGYVIKQQIDSETFNEIRSLLYFAASSAKNIRDDFYAQSQDLQWRQNKVNQVFGIEEGPLQQLIYQWTVEINEKTSEEQPTEKTLTPIQKIARSFARSYGYIDPITFEENDKYISTDQDTPQEKRNKEFLNTLLRIDKVQKAINKTKAVPQNFLNKLEFKLVLIPNLIEIADYLINLSNSESLNTLSQELLEELLPLIGYLHTLSDQIEIKMGFKEGAVLSYLDPLYTKYSSLQKKLIKKEIISPAIDLQRYESARKEALILEKKQALTEGKINNLKPIYQVLKQYESTPLIDIPTKDVQFILNNLEHLPLENTLKETYKKYLTERLKNENIPQKSSFFGFFVPSTMTQTTEWMKKQFEFIGNKLSWTRHSEVVQKVHDHLVSLEKQKNNFGKMKEKFSQIMQKTSKEGNVQSSQMQTYEISDSDIKIEISEEKKSDLNAQNFNVSALQKIFEEILNNYFDESFSNLFKDGSGKINIHRSIPVNENEGGVFRAAKIFSNLLFEVEQNRGQNTFLQFFKGYLSLKQLDRQTLVELYQFINSIFPQEQGFFQFVRDSTNVVEKELMLEKSAITLMTYDIKNSIKNLITISDVDDSSANKNNLLENFSPYNYLIGMISSEIEKSISPDVNEQKIYEIKNTDSFEQRRAKLLLNTVRYVELIQESILKNGADIFPLIENVSKTLNYYRDVIKTKKNQYNKRRILSGGIKTLVENNNSGFIALVHNIIGFEKGVNSTIQRAEDVATESRELFKEGLKAITPYLNKIAIHIDQTEEKLFLKQGVLMNSVQSLFQLFETVAEANKIETSAKEKFPFLEARNEALHQRLVDADKNLIALAKRISLVNELLDHLRQYRTTALINIPREEIIFIREHLSSLILEDSLKKTYMDYLEQRLLQENNVNNALVRGHKPFFFFRPVSLANRVLEVTGNLFGWTKHSEVIKAAETTLSALLKEQTRLQRTKNLMNNRVIQAQFIDNEAHARTVSKNSNKQPVSFLSQISEWFRHVKTWFSTVRQNFYHEVLQGAFSKGEIVSETTDLRDATEIEIINYLADLSPKQYQEKSDQKEAQIIELAMSKEIQEKILEEQENSEQLKPEVTPKVSF